MKPKLLLVAALLFTTFLTSFKAAEKAEMLTTGSGWISSGSHAGGELTACDELFHARDLYPGDTVDWYVNNVYIGSTRDIYLTVSQHDVVSIIVNANDPENTYEYYDTINACE